MSNYNEFDIDDSVRLQTTFTVGDVPTNPTTDTLFVKDPSGNTDTYTGGQLTSPSTGVFYRDVEVDEVGSWGARMKGDGVCDAASQLLFQVRRSKA